MIDPERVKAVRDLERPFGIRDAILVCSSSMSLPLYLVFWIADLFYAPILKWEFLFLRSLIVPASLYVNYRFRRPITNAKVAQNIGIAFAFVNGILINIMIFLSKEGAKSPYYAGLNLVALGILSFFPWTLSYFFLAIAVVFAPYYLVVLLAGVNDDSLNHLVLNSFFIVGTIVASSVIRWFSERLRSREIESRLELGREVETRNQIIKIKTEEEVRYQNLSKQFSPQVVSSIKQGKLNVFKASEETEICVIELDIAGSTAGLERIGPDSYDKLLEMFYNDVLRILFAFDITFDKYIGDAILAFSNEPVKYSDYIIRVVQAALQIREHINSKSTQRIYGKYWGATFQVKIGISSGLATVGFKGSDHVKSYTATGLYSVNLACRLCSDAKDGEILASHRIIEELQSKGFICELYQDAKEYKGFSEKQRVGSVVDYGKFDVSDWTITDKCPHGHGLLYLGEDEKNLHVLRCRKCEYVLV